MSRKVRDDTAGHGATSLAWFKLLVASRVTNRKAPCRHNSQIQVSGKSGKAPFELSVRAVDFCQEFVYYRCPVSARRGSKSLAWTYGNSGLRRFLLLAAKAVVVVYVILDGIVTPYSGRCCVGVKAAVCHSSARHRRALPHTQYWFCSPSLAFAEPPKSMLGSDGEGHLRAGLL